MTTASLGRQKRPGVVTFIGVIIYIQAMFAGIVAALAFFNKDDSYWQSQTGQDADSLLTLAIAEAVVALIMVWVASSLMSGGRGARTFVAIVMGIRIAVAGWAMLTHHAGGVFGASIITIAIAIFVLWALYGHAESDAYFESL